MAVALLLLFLLFVLVGLGFMMRSRAARLRRDAETREAQMLESLFAARRTGNAVGENINLDDVDATADAAGTALSADAAMREGVARASVVRPPVAAVPPATDGPIPVRDLVQTFYEARGYRVVPTVQSARPIELVLRHKSDPLRAYAFAPISAPLSDDIGRQMQERAARIDQPRVLIAAEIGVEDKLADALLKRGVRVLDRRAIESQLAKIDFAAAAKIRALARSSAARRSQMTLG